MVQPTAETPEQTSCPPPQGNRRKSRDEEVYSDLFLPHRAQQKRNKSGGFCCRNGKKPLFYKSCSTKGCGGWPQKRKSGAFPLWKNKEYGIISCTMRHRQAVRQGTLTPHRRFDSCWRNQKPRRPEKAGGAFCVTFFHKVWPNGVKLSGGGSFWWACGGSSRSGTSTESKLQRR